MDPVSFSQHKAVQPTTAQIIKSSELLSLASKLLKGAPIQTSYLKDTSFEFELPQNVDSHALRIELYRKIISINPNSYIAITNLAICISQGASLALVDLKNTRFEYSNSTEININELVADLYRRSIKINRYHTMAICNLATCFYKGVLPLQTDFLGTKFERKAIQNISFNDLILSLYRKARRLNPDDPLANYTLGISIFNGSAIEEADLCCTSLEEKALANINRIELAAEFFRKFIKLNAKNYNPMYNEAIYLLSLCWLEGASITFEDLLNTEFEGELPEKVNSIKLASSIFNDIIKANPMHRGAIEQLTFCKTMLKQETELPALLESQPSYLVSYNAMASKAVAVDLEKPEKDSKSSHIL